MIYDDPYPNNIIESEKNTDDLELAEINYLCIVASFVETTKKARLNMFSHCLDHLLPLFDSGEYD